MSEPSYITCPCGFRAEGTPKDALAGYRAHQCSLHEPAATAPTWPGVVAWIALLLFLSFACTKGWGLWS